MNNTDVQTYTSESQVLTFIWTKNETFNSVSCLNDDAFWSCGHDDNTLRLYNHQGVLIQLVGTKSGYELWDIAVTTDRNLVYTDLIEFQSIKSIQWNDKNNSFYSQSVFKSLFENRNFHICVTISEAGEVVVNGKLRFIYTGSHSTPREESFDPVAMTTGSQGNILITDNNNDRINILDRR